MAKLLWVGRNDDNKGGRSSKGYTIRRKRRSVVMRWGPVEVIGGRRRSDPLAVLAAGAGQTLLISVRRLRVHPPNRSKQGGIGVDLTRPRQDSGVAHAIEAGSVTTAHERHTLLRRL